MEEFILNKADLLSEFLSKNINNSKKSDSNILFSFAFKQDHFSIGDNVEYFFKYFEKSFYFKKPAENSEILGLESALTLSENSDSRFVTTEKKVKEWKSRFVNNWDEFDSVIFPLFVGGMKFTNERKEGDWQDFDDSDWFVPEFIFYKNEDKSFLIYNFVYSGNISSEILVEKFKNKLNKILSFTENKNKTEVKITNIIGASPKEKKKWKNLVSECLDNIQDEKIDKIVLSRKVEITLSSDPSFRDILQNLSNRYPLCYIFVFHHGKSTFFGATPEKLAKFNNGKLEIDALAGSARRGKDPEEDLEIETDLLKDKKNLNEHNFVIDYIKQAIAGLTVDAKFEEKCKIRKLENIQHLWTPITAELKSENSMLNILKELYPTPAICGMPKDSALSLIKRIEGYKRGLYSGVIGWFNFDDAGEFVVAIRSALTIGNKVFAFAGGGIVENSDPDSEYRETELKLKTIMALFENENKNKS